MFGELFGGGTRRRAIEPATEKQKKFAGTLGVKNVDVLSKDQATVEIDKKLKARARSRKGWISSLERRVEALENKVGKKGVRKAAKKASKKKKKK
jgi:hypothetical protein